MRGRPPKPPAEVRSVAVFTRLTEAEAAVLDRRRGKESRASYLRRDASRSSQAKPATRECGR